MQSFQPSMLGLHLYQFPQTLAAGNSSIWHNMTDALDQSFYRALTLIIAILPGILAFILALVVFSLIGMGLSALLRRGLTAARIDDRLDRGKTNGGGTISTSPSALIARAAFWAMVLLGLIIGVSAFDASLATLPGSLMSHLTEVVGAVFLLIAGTLIARFLARSVLIEAVNSQIHYARLLSLGVKWLVFVLTGAMVLNHLQIGGNVVDLAFGILFGGIVLTIVLAVGLGSRDFVSRSLESHDDRFSERTTATPATPINSNGDPIRHF